LFEVEIATAITLNFELSIDRNDTIWRGKALNLDFVIFESRDGNANLGERCVSASREYQQC
jgi:hypothetical protein